MKKLLTLFTLLLTVCSGAWATEASLKTLAVGTTSFKTGDTGYHQWTGAKTKNQVIYDKDVAENNRLMGWSNGNDLVQDAAGLKFGNSKKKSAFVFRVGSTSNISVSVARNGSDMTVSLYYLGTTTDVLTDPDGMSPTGALSSVSLSSSTTSGTLTKSGGAAGYYMVFGTLRFIAESITVTSSTTYTVTYKAGAGTGDDVVDDKAATVADCPGTFTAPSGKVFSGWNTASDGSGTAYAVGATVTGDLTLFAQWATAYHVSYNGNGADSGSAPTDAKDYINGSTVTVLGNTGSLVKNGYTHVGWNTESEGTGIGYVAGSTFTMSTADVTLYAIWAENDYSWSQKTTSGTVDVGSEVETSTGGKMTVETATIRYAGTGIEFSSSAAVSVTLDKKMQEGTIITGTLYYNGTNNDRTLYLKNSSGTTKDTWQLNAVEDTHTSESFQYIVTDGDGLAGSKTFKLVRKNNVYLTSLTVANCAPLYSVTLDDNGEFGGNGSAKISEGDDALTIVSEPTRDGYVVDYYKTAADGAKVAEADGSLVASITGFTDGDGKWTATTDKTLYTEWKEGYAITKGTPENGTITVDKTSATAGTEVTLTATPAFHYLFGSWNVYKTGDPETTVTVTDNKFTMPAYAVTVNATFTKDSKKYILYLTSTSESDTKKDDKLYAALNSVDTYKLFIEAPGSQTLANYDLIVLHESIGGTSDATAVTGCKTTTTPVLNTKSYFYGADGDATKRWKWGAPNAGTSVKGATLNTDAFSNIADHPIFAGVTISTNFFEITDEAAAKCMQPVGSFVAGKEGFTLATTPNAESGNGAAIHELTPAQRGAASGKYLLISVSSAKLNALNENGQLLFKNAAAYLLGDEQWMPTAIPVTISAAKYATFASNYDLDFSGVSGLYAYTATVSGDELTFTKVTGSVKAGEGLLLYSATATKYDVPVATDSPSAVSGNKLVRGTGAAVASAGEGETKNYILSNNGGVINFYLANGKTVGTNKAYLKNIPNTTSAKISLPVGDDEEETDGIKAVSTVVENGVRYNLAGQRVGNDYKGIVIVNGKKMLNK